MANLLDGKVALITGGAAGIGRATAVLFAQHGAHVLVMDKDREALDRLQADFNSAQWPLTPVEGDVCITADLQRAMHMVEQQFGKLDILVNNVGDFLGLVKP